MSEKKKQTKKKEKILKVEEIIQDWEKLFPSPKIAQEYKTIANQLIKCKLGQRGNETSTAFLLRIQYCAAKEIPMCFVNSTYIVQGKVSEMVDLKMWRFKKTYPHAEFIVQMCNKQKMIKIGRINPETNWVKVEWSVEKAKKLKLYHDSKAQWKENTQSMLNARCNGQLVDILGGLETSGAGHLSVEEINSLGIEIEELES